MRTFQKLSLIAVAMVLAAGCAIGPTRSAPQEKEVQKEKTVPGKLPLASFKMNSLDGEPVELSRYSGKVLLIVNTASKCGYTKQYAGLQELHRKYSGQGLAVLGFPSDDFGGQEPGTDEQIGEFCRQNYGVEFDMFSKVKVKGEEKTPLYNYLTSEQTNAQFPGEVGWNFEKFLIGRDGKIVARYKSKITPESEEIVKAIESELAK